MHQNLWPHIAASPDGAPEHGKWPKYPNNTFHSYEVHSDWTQLMEEYGVVGLVLLLIPAGLLAFLLLSRRSQMLRRRREDGRGASDYGLLLGALLAIVALAFHSLGDFNLQMPATVWMLAAIVATPVAHLLREPYSRSRRSRRTGAGTEESAPP